MQLKLGPFVLVGLKKWRMRAFGPVLPHAAVWTVLTFARDEYPAVVAFLKVILGRWRSWKLHISVGYLIGRDLKMLRLAW